MLNEERLKELVPDLKVKTTYIENAFKCEAVYKWDAKKQTDNLRKAVKQLIKLHNIHPSNTIDMLKWWSDTMDILEQITGIPYNEIGE